MRNPLTKLTAKEEDERRSHERSRVPRVLLNIFAIGMVVVIAGGVLALVVAYWMGRRAGKSKAQYVEIRRV